MVDINLLSSLDIRLNSRQTEQLTLYRQLLLEWNQRMDLTKVPEDEISLRHFADSLRPYALGLLKRKGSLIDVGTGAGLPGVPLAIAMPELQVTLLETQRKRCDFLHAVVEHVQLPHVQVIWGRAEDLGRGALREQFDYACARALASLPVLAEYLLPFVKLGGQALCWKGPGVLEEQASGERAARILGGKLGRLISLDLPGRDSLLQTLEKISPTPEQYPRKAGTPSRNPL